MKFKNNKNKSNRNENGKNENDVIDIVIINSDLKKYLTRLPRKNKPDNEIKLNDVRQMLLKNEYDSDDDFHLGSNCRFLYFSKCKAVIRPSDEHKLGLLEVVEKKDNNHYLYINQNAEFDLTQLRFEKGFKINKDGSVTSASVQAFKINLDQIKLEKITHHRDGVYECNHETTTDCKRSLIFDVNLTAAYSEWISNSFGLSHENSEQTFKKNTKYTKHLFERVLRGVINLPILDKDIIAVKNFIEDVENAVSDTTNDNDKINKLYEISEKYGHFYARRLILGGAIIRNEEYTKYSVEQSKSKTTNAQVGVGIAKNIFKSEVNDVYSNKNNYYNNITNNVETIIGGADYFYDKTSWIQSLNDATKWKIIGYEEVYSLFELLDHELKQKVLNVIGHQILEAKVEEIRFNIKEYESNKKPYIHKLLITKKISSINECNILASIVSVKNNVFSLHVDYMDGNKNRPVIVIHHIQGEKPRFKNKIKIKLGWIIFGPPTSFDFSIQYPLVFKSRKFQPFREQDHPIINNCGMFGTCVLETANITPQIETSSQVENSLRVKNNPQIENSQQIENSSQTEGNSDIGEVICDQIKYDPRNSTFAIGNYLIRCQEPAHQESAWLFVYDIEAKKKVTDENILKRLSLNRCIIDTTNSRQINDFFGEMKFNWIKVKNKEILYSSEEIKTSNDNLILVNQIFDHDECKNCQPLGFVNIISDKIFYGSLNSKHPNIVESDGSIVYLSIPLKSIDKC
ncbi:hsp70 family protein [Gigaspora margarita]|uniref:Hsp70 family protein n=1 Tax=Gigaspora margarita TaxID=4874 RepID=A0A8H3WV79_GIGMA|nr:hsp70 family protein [Gigaspora margarita]